jgi:hypothetical protein
MNTLSPSLKKYIQLFCRPLYFLLFCVEYKLTMQKSTWAWRHLSAFSFAKSYIRDSRIASNTVIIIFYVQYSDIEYVVIYFNY